VTEVREDLGVEELAALVCSTLERHGVRVVLSGGSVVSIYSDNAYQSYDLDFIQTGLARTTNPAMEELGFAKQGRHWLHPRTAFLVEFPPGPVQVGAATITGRSNGRDRRWKTAAVRRVARRVRLAAARRREPEEEGWVGWRRGGRAAERAPRAGDRACDVPIFS
jgi:hypothetical protein